ncbi:hypothetical protein [Luteimonas sp. 100069]|uniref:hypothetical protein n=1 Tax=Luteimonas sp. 100069 TaxID=2006109 RepID=UPI000F4E49A1|nr:hypothetical protein [Luteimonas sp. 100069]RPD87651.1 hypothetical protein EGK76_00065 [Luteimonas sp. 100069]
MRNPGVRIALGATVLVHAGIAWWLLGLREAPPVDSTIALQVAWIDRPATPSLPALPERPAPATTTRTRRVSTSAQPRPLQSVDVPAAASPSEPSSPDAAALLDQARDWARTQSPQPAFTHDPLQRRPPPAADGRFAMRGPITPEDIAKGIGQLFGGAGYTQDPCPQIRRNIANLGTGGDTELASEEIRRLRQFCL